VWFNCEDSYEKDGQTISYGDEGYEYNETNCELWRIIGVFDVEGTKRVKIINTSSTFTALWDLSASDVNNGYGVNQWGATNTYEGANLMSLLNGYYIETNDDNIADEDKSACTYCSLLKPLTASALGMISNAKWYTYATNTSTASTAYLQERGIIPETALTGKDCTPNDTYCSDSVARENEWTGKVGLMYLSDMQYANGWLYTSGKGVSYVWSISPYSKSSGAYYVWYADSSFANYGDARFSFGVWPALYLNSNVEIIDGDGSSTKTTDGTGPYIIKKMSVSA